MEVWVISVMVIIKPLTGAGRGSENGHGHDVVRVAFEVPLHPIHTQSQHIYHLTHAHTPLAGVQHHSQGGAVVQHPALLAGTHVEHVIAAVKSSLVTTPSIHV